jgi:hypothetical protein
MLCEQELFQTMHGMFGFLRRVGLQPNALCEVVAACPAAFSTVQVLAPPPPLPPVPLFPPPFSDFHGPTVCVRGGGVGEIVVNDGLMKIAKCLMGFGCGWSQLDKALKVTRE